MLQNGDIANSSEAPNRDIAFKFAVKSKEGKRQNLKTFEDAIKSAIDSKVYDHAKRTRTEEGRKKNYEELPRTEEIEIFSEFLHMRLEENMEELREKPNKRSHAEITRLTACILLVFNRTRSGEIGKVKVVNYEYKKGTGTNDEFFESLLDGRKDLRSEDKRMDFAGKNRWKRPCVHQPQNGGVHRECSRIGVSKECHLATHTFLLHEAKLQRYTRG